jgi:hypothetical protein
LIPRYWLIPPLIEVLGLEPDLDDETPEVEHRINVEQKGAKISKSESKKKKQKKTGNNKKKADVEFENRNTFEGIYLPSICYSDVNGIITSCEKKGENYAPPIIRFRVMVDRAGSIKAILIALFLTLICRQISGFNVDGKSNIDWYWTPSASGKASVENISSVAPGSPIVNSYRS